MKQLYLVFMAVLLITNNVIAADIAADIRNAAAGPDVSNGGYFEVGLGFQYVERSFVSAEDDGVYGTLDVAGAYRYNRLFVELSQGTLDGLNLGYHLWSNNNWSVDLLGASINGIFNVGNDDDISALSEAQRNEAILDRDAFYNGAGFRATAYFGNNILQYRLVTDIHDNNGVVSTLRLGRSWQLRNWNLHGVVSADYASAKTSQYLYSVTQNEATARFPEYDVGSTMSYIAEVGLTYPISEHFVFRSTARYTQLSNGEQNSPLTDSGDRTYIGTSIHYVF